MTQPLSPGAIRRTHAPMRRSLLDQLGRFDEVALIQWLDDESSRKVCMPHEGLQAHGVKAGDLLITDPTAKLEAGNLAVVDFAMVLPYVGVVENGDDGRLQVKSDGFRFNLDDWGSHASVQRVIGFIPLVDGVEFTDEHLPTTTLLPKEAVPEPAVRFEWG